MKTNYECRCTRIDNLRKASQDRHLARLERLEKKAAPMVGELASGKYYAFPIGGKYFESSSHTEVVDYLIRNKYVRRLFETGQARLLVPSVALGCTKQTQAGFALLGVLFLSETLRSF